MPDRSFVLVKHASRVAAFLSRDIEA